MIQCFSLAHAAHRFSGALIYARNRAAIIDFKQALRKAEGASEELIEAVEAIGDKCCESSRHIETTFEVTRNRCLRLHLILLNNGDTHRSKTR